MIDHDIQLCDGADNGRKSRPWADEHLDAVFLSSQLVQENLAYAGRGGVSAENRSNGFRPAFMDFSSGAVYPSRFSDGRLAPIHLYDGLPDDLVLGRNCNGGAVTVKATVISGFVRDGHFYTRVEASRAASEDGAAPSRYPTFADAVPPTWPGNEYRPSELHRCNA